MSQKDIPDTKYFRPEQPGNPSGLMRRRATLWERFADIPEHLIDNVDEPVLIGEYRLVRTFTMTRKTSYVQRAPEPGK